MQRAILLNIHEEDSRAFNPKNRSEAEQRAYLQGVSETNARKAKTAK